jgi:mannan endo-1,4-beta-mannosidase
VERWGHSGTLFAWDLWNEIHPSYAQDSAECFNEFIEQLSDCVRSRELELFGRSHPQTVSVFGPHMVLDRRIPETIFRHPSLDFASTHFYEEGTIDFPLNTVDAALSTGKLMREALAELRDRRPFMDSEHGPIHTFKDHHKTLPEPFDDEYFRHMQWAHLCAGGAGGGMRWPNRTPHSLTAGMRVAQRGLARFLRLIDWQQFERRNWNEEVKLDRPEVRAVASGDRRQALLWLLRTDRLDDKGMLRRDVEPVAVEAKLPCLQAGQYEVTAWNTLEGRALWETVVDGPGSELTLRIPDLITDMAVAIRHV